eukprot:m.253007 g.253007  ORF g.253007 m.253007 type:complete len:188 (+) comp15479_c0_seq4:74-637(+)
MAVVRRWQQVLVLLCAATMVYITLQLVAEDDRWILQRRPLSQLSASDVPIFISDEHQHALPRWYEYAQRRRMRGFALVHVDAHSDMAIPSSFTRDSSSLHNDPIDREHVRTSNDEFIEDAVYTELVDRVTWIIPDWGQENEGEMFEDQWNHGRVTGNLVMQLLSKAVQHTMKTTLTRLPATSLAPYH